jgi:hypothetical protein
MAYMESEEMVYATFTTPRWVGLSVSKWGCRAKLKLSACILDVSSVISQVAEELTYYM